MLVLGITGPIGSGKDVVTNYLNEEYGFETFSCGDAIREIAKERDIEPTRENLQELGKSCREKQGNGFLGQKAAEMARNSHGERIAVNGIRSPEEVDVLRKSFDESFVLINVKTDEKTRFERLRNRGRKGDPGNFEDFKKQDRKDKEKFGMEETFSKADLEIENNGSIKELHYSVDKMLSDIIP